MDAFTSALVKMSLRGVVIILVVLLVRLLLKKLQISHKYILGLWAMAFLYFIIPWKLSLSVGFWNNVHILEEVRSKIDDDFIVEEYDDSAVYWTREPIDDSYLGFSFYDNGLYFVFESAVRPD